MRNITRCSKEEELRDTNEWFEKLGCKEIPKYVVVSAGRHHIRFFPDAGKAAATNIFLVPLVETELHPPLRV